MIDFVIPFLKWFFYIWWQIFQMLAKIYIQVLYCRCCVSPLFLSVNNHHNNHQRTTVKKIKTQLSLLTYWSLRYWHFLNFSSNIWKHFPLLFDFLFHISHMSNATVRGWMIDWLIKNWFYISLLHHMSNVTVRGARNNGILIRVKSLIRRDF